MTDPLEIALEAREAARSAHYRLDRMNGSLDRLAASLDRVDGKVDSVLITLAQNDGASNATKSFLDSKRWWIVLVAGVLTSAGFAAVMTLILSHH